jgi:hypothetical protein
MRNKERVSEMTYRVVYGETMPAWEQEFPTAEEANAFAKKHESFGDIIFGITKVSPGQGPQSLTGVLAKYEKIRKDKP